MRPMPWGIVVIDRSGHFYGGIRCTALDAERIRCVTFSQ